MRSRRWAAALFSALLATVSFAPRARAGTPGDELLLKVDRATSSTSNKVWLINMRLVSTDGDVREAKMLMLQGTGERRIMRFLNPASMRNTALLSLGNHEFYVFLGPENRTRRLGASALNQTFLGSDFTFEDLSEVNFHLTFDAQIAGEAGGQTRLQLTPKKSGDSLWSKLVMTIDAHALIHRIEYYDKDGRHVRTLTRDNQRGKTTYESWVPTRLVMVNELTHHATELVIDVADPDHPIPDRVFSLRGLQRGDDLQFSP